MQRVGEERGCIFKEKNMPSSSLLTIFTTLQNASQRRARLSLQLASSAHLGKWWLDCMLADLGQKEMSNFQFGSFSQTGVLRLIL